MVRVDVLIPTYRRTAALAVTLTALGAQSLRDLRVVVSDQTEDCEAAGEPEVAAVVRYLDAHGITVEFHRHLPRRGLAEQRQFLLDQAKAPFVLFLDDDVMLEPDLIGRLVDAIEAEACGFVGSAVVGLRYLDVRRPEEEAIEFWDGPVQPETVRPGGAAWERYRLHNACNLWHVSNKLGMTAGSNAVTRSRGWAAASSSIPPSCDWQAASLSGRICHRIIAARMYSPRSMSWSASAAVASSLLALFTWICRP